MNQIIQVDPKATGNDENFVFFKMFFLKIFLISFLIGIFFEEEGRCYIF